MSNYLPLWPDQASTLAGPVDALYIYLLLVSGVMTALIFIAVAVLAIKYRRRPGREAQQIEGSTVLEIGWTVTPFFIMVTFFIGGAVIFFQERTPPADATEVYVVAKQWMWKVEHMEGQREINALHVPTGENVKLIMTSQDVIHSFYVPAFRLKQDVLPGRYTTLWFNATRPGTYHLFCAEYCGTNHSGMGGDIVVMEPQDYALWMAGGPALPLQETGKQLFTQFGCATCHRSDVQGRGPNLVGVYNKPVQLEDGRTVIADENYVRESILNPTAKIVKGFNPVMPTFQGIISDEQLNALVAYVKSLSQLPSSQSATGTAGLQDQPAASPDQTQKMQVQ
jgi:cytochrome c oxidase subunit II